MNDLAGLLVIQFVFGVAVALCVWSTTARMHRTKRILLSALAFSVCAAPGLIAGRGHPPVGIAPFIIAVLSLPSAILFDLASLLAVWTIASLMLALFTTVGDAVREDSSGAEHVASSVGEIDSSALLHEPKASTRMGAAPRTLPYAAASLIVYAGAGALALAAGNGTRGIGVVGSIYALLMACIPASMAWLGFRAGVNRRQVRPDRMGALGLGLLTSAAASIAFLAMKQILHAPFLVSLLGGLVVLWGSSFYAPLTVKKRR